MRTTTFCTSAELSFLSLSTCTVLLTWTTVGGSFAGPPPTPGFFLSGLSLYLYLSRTTSFKRRVTVFHRFSYLPTYYLFTYYLFTLFFINFSLLSIYSFHNYHLITHYLFISLFIRLSYYLLLLTVIYLPIQLFTHLLFIYFIIY